MGLRNSSSSGMTTPLPTFIGATNTTLAEEDSLERLLADAAKVRHDLSSLRS